MLCNECSSRAFCSSMCPELEIHLKEIEITQKEKTIGEVKYSYRYEYYNEKRLTKRESEIAALMLQKVPMKEIASQLNITYGSLTSVVSKMRRRYDMLLQYERKV